MMKKLFLLLIMTIASNVYAQEISYVERKGSYLKIYDEKGKLHKTHYISAGNELLGWSNKLVAVRQGSYLYIYNADMKRLNSVYMSNNCEFTGVAGDMYTLRKGSYIYTYTSTGKQISSRYSSKK